MIQVLNIHHDTFQRTFKGKYIRNKTPPNTIKQIRLLVNAGASMKLIAKTLHVSLELSRAVRDGKR